MGFLGYCFVCLFLQRYFKVHILAVIQQILYKILLVSSMAMSLTHNPVSIFSVFSNLPGFDIHPLHNLAARKGAIPVVWTAGWASPPQRKVWKTTPVCLLDGGLSEQFILFIITHNSTYIRWTWFFSSEDFWVVLCELVLRSQTKILSRQASLEA